MNVHLSFTDINNESRIFKEAFSLIEANVFNNIIIVGYHAEGLKKIEYLHPNIKLVRVSLPHLALAPRLLTKAVRVFILWVNFFFLCISNKPKVINVHALELLPIGALTKLFTGAKLVYDAHELETERVVLKGYLKNIAKILERLFIGFANLTIVVGPKIETFYRNRYKNLNIITVRNCPRFEKTKNNNALRTEFNIPKETTIYIFSGALNKSRNIPRLISFFEHHLCEKRALIFMGKGHFEEKIKASPAFGKTIFLKQAVAPHKVTENLASADVGIHLGEDICLSYRLCLPNKMFEYIMARIPLLVTRLPEMEKIINTYHIGTTVNDLSDSTLIQAMEEIEKQPSQKMKKNIDRAAQDLNWENEEKTLVNAIRKLVT